MKLNTLTKYILTACFAILVFGTGFRAGEQSAVKQSQDRFASLSQNQIGTDMEISDVDFSLFWETWDTVQSKFVDTSKLDSKTMFYGAVKGMVSSLEDPYTFFLTPEENQQNKDDLGGKFEGIGAELGLREGRIVIISPLKNSPAQQAGVLAGDIIIEVDGVSTESWSLQKAVSEIRGEKDTTVTLTLWRGAANTEVIVEIQRDTILIESVELTREQGVAILKLNRFGDATNGEWDSAVKEIASMWENGSIKGMVLDVRGNPGGYLLGAVYVASEFLPRDTLIVTQEYTDGSEEPYTSKRGGKLQDIPLVVLINEGSASASEIVAGALRDHKRATIVGQKSFGKGSVQEAIDLSGGAGLHVTVAKWVLPDGDWINSKGILPEEEVENITEEGSTATRETDSQLDRALEVLLK